MTPAPGTYFTVFWSRRTGGTGWVKREVKLVPLFSEDLGEKGLRENFEELCKGESLR